MTDGQFFIMLFHMTKLVDKLFVAVKAFVMYEGKVLLIQESSQYTDGTRAGKWDMPGGRIQPGETWQDALIREVREETGLEVKIGRPFSIGEWYPEVRSERWHIVATFVMCEAVTNSVTLSEDHIVYHWFTPEEITTLTNCASHINEAAQDYLNK